MNEKYLPTAARLILGATFLGFGINGFLDFMPMPMPEMPGAAGEFMAGLLVVLALYLAWSFRDVYRPLLSAGSTPTAKKQPAERYQYDSPMRKPAEAR
jgi:hypothetical protein